MFVSFLLGVLYFQVALDSESQARWLQSELLTVWQMAVVMVLPVPVHAIGLALGVVGLFFPSRRKLFPILAIGLNAVFGLCSLIPWVWLALHAPGVK